MHHLQITSNTSAVLLNKYLHSCEAKALEREWKEGEDLLFKLNYNHSLDL